MSGARRWRPKALIPGLGLTAMVVAVMALYFFNMNAINAVLTLPYAGLSQGALAFTPQITFHLAVWSMVIIIGVAVLVLASRLFFGAKGGFSGKFRPYWLGAIGLMFALFALSRLDYWVAFPDRLVVQRPWGQTAHAMSGVQAVEVGCHTIQRSRSNSYRLIYQLRFGGRGFNLANSDIVLPNDLEAVLTRIEGLQPRLLAQGVPYRAIGVSEECLIDHIEQLDAAGAGGAERLARIGVHR